MRGENKTVKTERDGYIRILPVAPLFNAGCGLLARDGLEIHSIFYSGSIMEGLPLLLNVSLCLSNMHTDRCNIRDTSSA